MGNSHIDGITGEIVDAAIRLHMGIGPGCFESVYERLMAHELVRRGMGVERQKVIGFEYEGMTFETGFKVDILVEGLVVVEIKAVERLAPVAPKQVLTYLRLLRLPAGLLLNFGAATMKEGIQRIANSHSSVPPRLRVK